MVRFARLSTLSTSVSELETVCTKHAGFRVNSNGSSSSRQDPAPHRILFQLSRICRRGNATGCVGGFARRQSVDARNMELALKHAVESFLFSP